VVWCGGVVWGCGVGGRCIGVVWCGVVECGVVCCGVLWCGVVWWSKGVKYNVDMMDMYMRILYYNDGDRHSDSDSDSDRIDRMEGRQRGV
jgi:hypothetical protein